ncbi:hypothetical protein [Peribacillus frigoritolerans]|uniref:hypothetical protein n=1 Tax=Peribacillus frigoritolerans TaxID=450367 RepID=UPI003394EC99
MDVTIRDLSGGRPSYSDITTGLSPFLGMKKQPHVPRYCRNHVAEDFQVMDGA